MKTKILIRFARESDLEKIRVIYNQGIADRIATLDTEEKDMAFMKEWFANHQGRYCVIVAETGEQIIGWASLNQYSKRTAYDGVADLSIYINRDFRGKGIGSQLLISLEQAAISNDFYKIILFTFSHNEMAQTLYRKNGYQEVGIFQNQGKIDGEFIDIMAMEKLFF